MSDLRTQLATYFDAVVARVDVDDVSDASAVDLRPHRQPVRSSWLYAAGAAAVVVLLGAISFWALPRDSDPSNNPPAATVDTTSLPPGVSALPPVTLGVRHVWPETPSGLSSVELAELFANEVLGWNSAGATEFSDAVPNGPAWLHIRQPGVEELVDVLTVPSEDGAGRVIVEAGTPWARGVDLRPLEGGGVSITLLRIVEADAGEVVLRLSDGTQVAGSTPIDLSTTAPVRVEFPEVSLDEIGSILIRYVNRDGTVVAAAGATPNADSTSNGPLDEPIMSEATPIEFEEIDGLLPDGLRSLPDDDWYSIPAGDFAAFVLLREGESPHVIATSCDVLNAVSLPNGWEGTCIEMTIDGVRVTGAFGYNQTLPDGAYADEQGFVWYATDCPDADVLLSAPSADALPNIETTSREHVEAIAQTSPEYRLIPRNGWVWETTDDGGFRVLQVEDFMLERTIENANQCPSLPAHATEGVPVAYRIAG